jgi:hypothetical protein
MQHGIELRPSMRPTKCHAENGLRFMRNGLQPNATEKASCATQRNEMQR